MIWSLIAIAYFFFLCEALLARCCRYLAFCLAEPEPCAPVIYFFFLALVFTLSSSLGPPLEAPLKTMPCSMISSMSDIIVIIKREKTLLAPPKRGE